MRLLTAYIDPKTGHERCGTGAHAQCFHYDYPTAKHLIAHGLPDRIFPVGQYNVYTWPRASTPRKVGTVYKKAHPTEETQ